MAYPQKALNISLNKWLISTLEKKVLVDQKLRVQHAACQSEKMMGRKF